MYLDVWYWEDGLQFLLIVDAPLLQELTIIAESPVNYTIIIIAAHDALLTYGPTQFPSLTKLRGMQEVSRARPLFEFLSHVFPRVTDIHMAWYPYFLDSNDAVYHEHISPWPKLRSLEIACAWKIMG